MDTHFLGVGVNVRCFSVLYSDRETGLNQKLEEVQAQIAVLAPFYCLSSLFVDVGCCALLILS